MATLTKQVDNLNKRVVALENSELEASDAVPFIVKLYADFEVSPVIECGDGGYSGEKLELVINGAVKEVTNKIANGGFNDGTAGWTAFASTLSVTNNILISIGTGANLNTQVISRPDITRINGDKIYFDGMVRVTNSNCTGIRIYANKIGGGSEQLVQTVALSPNANQWYKISAVLTINQTLGNMEIYIRHSYADATTSNGKVMEVEGWNGETANAGIYVINLTAEFGAGNEPTAAQMKAAIDEYRARVYPECSEDTELTAGAQGAAEELSTKINYSAVGTGIVPAPGTIGMPDEAARKPVGTVTTVESSETETVIVFSSFFDEQAANGETLTSAAVLYDATDSIGTGAVVASEAINIEKTSAKTLTVSAEITITEVV